MKIFKWCVSKWIRKNGLQAKSWFFKQLDDLMIPELKHPHVCNCDSMFKETECPVAFCACIFGIPLPTANFSASTEDIEAIPSAATHLVSNNPLQSMCHLSEARVSIGSMCSFHGKRRQPNLLLRSSWNEMTSKILTVRHSHSLFKSGFATTDMGCFGGKQWPTCTRYLNAEPNPTCNATPY